jgi:hypothetical protein
MVLQFTNLDSDTSCQCNQIYQVQICNGQAVWSEADLRHAPRVGITGKGHTVNEGLGVCGNGSTVCEMDSGQETGAWKQVNQQRRAENNRSKMKIIWK